MRRVGVDVNAGLCRPILGLTYLIQQGIINGNGLFSSVAFKGDVSGNVFEFVSFSVSDSDKRTIKVIFDRYVFEMDIPCRARISAQKWTPFFGPRNAGIKLGFQVLSGLCFVAA